MKRKTGTWIAFALLLIVGIVAALILGLRGCQNTKKAPDTGSNPGTEAIETEQPTDTKNAAPTTEATQNGETQTEPTTEDESASTEPASETAGTEEPGTDAATTTEPVTEPTSSTEPQLTEPQPTEPKPTEPQPTEPKPTDPTEPPHTHSYTSKVTKAATCTENGVTTYTCSCGDSYTKNEPKALGHNMGSWTVTKAATCTQSGTKTRSCQRSGCSYKETDTIPATGHNWGSWKQTQAPTCTAKGKEQRICSRCNKTESRDVAALGHNWDNGTVTTQPTCSNAGVRTYHCKRTGCSKTKTEVLPATGNHSWKQTQAPTCANNGTETCSVCHKTRSVNALGHDWEYHPAETEWVEIYKCTCGAIFYSGTDWESHFYSYLDTAEEDNHAGYQNWSEEHVIKPAYNKCKRCGMENPA